jgi:hypothetical protein
MTKVTDYQLGYHTGGQMARVRGLRGKMLTRERRMRRERNIVRRALGRHVAREWARSPFAAGFLALAEDVVYMRTYAH